MNLTLVTAPATEPVAVADAKTHLRVDTSADDTLIEALITAARQHVEAVTRRALITQTWDMALDAFPAGRELRLPLPPLQSVTSIKYTDSDGVESTFSSGDYVVDTAVEPGRVVLGWNKTWPSATLQVASAVKVRFVAGYGSGETDVPQAIRQAMLLLIGHWYENRETVLIGATSRALELTTEALLWPYRMFRW